MQSYIVKVIIRSTGLEFIILKIKTLVSGIRYSGCPQASARLVNANLHIRSLKDIPVFRTWYIALATKIEKDIREVFYICNKKQAYILGAT